MKSFVRNTCTSRRGGLSMNSNVITPTLYNSLATTPHSSKSSLQREKLGGKEREREGEVRREGGREGGRESNNN